MARDMKEIGHSMSDMEMVFSILVGTHQSSMKDSGSMISSMDTASSPTLTDSRFKAHGQMIG